jgi:pimeloyl-ACP methyl ester carboxylesterase
MQDTLPAAALIALDRPSDGERFAVEAAGIPFSALAWGHEGDRPLLLIHGVTASAATWWRLAPAFAATGRRVVAVDLPGHGQTGHWTGHHRIRDNAADVAAFAAAAGLDQPDLQVIGHSWGAVTTAALPAAGLRPERLVMVDPPVAPLADMAAMVDDPDTRPYRDLDVAAAAIRAANPDWGETDVLVKAEGLTQLDGESARAVLADNGDWDGGLADLAEPAAADVPVWLIRGEPEAGGLVPDAAVPAFAARIGAGHILTIAGAGHSPHRVQPVVTAAALLHALET